MKTLDKIRQDRLLYHGRTKTMKRWNNPFSNLRHGAEAANVVEQRLIDVRGGPVRQLSKEEIAELEQRLVIRDGEQAKLLRGYNEGRS